MTSEHLIRSSFVANFIFAFYRGGARDIRASLHFSARLRARRRHGGRLLRPVLRGACLFGARATRGAEARARPRLDVSARDPDLKPNSIFHPSTPPSCVSFGFPSLLAPSSDRDAQGHKGKFGHEFLEFELRPDGKLRYANNSNYKHDTLIKKEMFVSRAVVEEAKRIVQASEIHKESDAQWPEGDRVGSQELEIVLGEEHITLTTTKIGSLLDVQNSKDPEGLRVFYYVVQDLKALVFSLINLHVKLRPIG